ncbi:hypothetical protein [Rhodanobacter sp. Root561]|uniref:hypothetical protein n=1 Tax=Rhodanobacter sp. Root561 TaxID=1736560 RepID=UPI000AE9EDF0|nr:hypothetical protein [Rhodanobacter sp. Root561]
MGGLDDEWRRFLLTAVGWWSDDAAGTARQPRFDLDLPGIPQHVVQRGNNRLPCFLDDLDRQRYLQCLWRRWGDSVAGCMPMC